MKLSLVLLLFVLTNAFAQTGTVAGRIQNEKYDYATPICRIKAVRAQDSTVSAPYSGDYGLSWIATGPDTLIISSSYESYEVLRYPVVIKPDTITVVDFTLRKRKWIPKLITYLPKPADIRGCVADNESGLPLQDVWIRAFRVPPRDANEEWDLRLGHGVSEDRTDLCGQFRLQGLSPGSYLLRLTRLDYEMSEQRVELQTGESILLDCMLAKRKGWN